jgi:hypothetical protein
MNLIPDSFKGQDFTKPITRAEFAAVCVKLFESLTGEKCVPADSGTFTDASDPEVLKAYNTDLMKGTDKDKFSPDTILNRETAATALTRVYKRVSIAGWTYDTDEDYTLKFNMPAKFPDDAKISGWAYQSVYFLVANGVIKGMDDGNFAPKNVTPQEVARGYANNTRQQALAMAVRIVENLKDKTPDYTVPAPKENLPLKELKAAIAGAGDDFNTIEITKTIVVGNKEFLEVPENIRFDFINDDDTLGMIVVEKGGALICGGKIVVGADGAIVIESGRVALRTYMFGEAITIYGDAYIPSGKQFSIQDAGDYFCALIVEPENADAAFTVRGTLTLDAKGDFGGFTEVRNGKMVVVSGATVELLGGGNISKSVIYEKGAILRADKDSLYSVISGVDEDGEEWTSIRGVEGVNEEGVYTFDGSKWVK